MTEQNNSQQVDVEKKGLPWWAWLLIIALVLALLLPLIIRVGGAYYRWGLGVDKKEEITVSSTQCPDCNCPQTEAKPTESPEEPANACLVKAASLDFPEDLANYVCAGSIGDGSDRVLESGSKIAFGTITVDESSAVWVLRNFIVPDTASYSYTYLGSEQNIFDADFFYNKECFDPATKERGVSCQICFDTESPGCELNLNFFDN